MRRTVILLAVLAAAACTREPAPAPTAGSAAPAAGSDTGPPVGSAPLVVGVTLHPYYSWTAAVAKDVPGVQVVPILPGEVDAGSYQPSTADIAKLASLDAIVVNGIGHDDFVPAMVKASGNTRLVTIEVNAETPTVPAAHGTAPNSHTFLSFTNAIQETGYIARRLGELRPGLRDALADNADAYVERLAALRTEIAGRLAHAKVKRVVTVHDGYSYLLQEFGIELAGVVEPAHGLTPSAKELTDLIALMTREHVTVVFSEETFPAKLLATLEAGTGAKVYVLSHVAVGSYAPDEFERVMTANAKTLVEALVDDPTP